MCTEVSAMTLALEGEAKNFIWVIRQGDRNRTQICIYIQGSGQNLRADLWSWLPGLFQSLLEARFPCWRTVPSKGSGGSISVCKITQVWIISHLLQESKASLRSSVLFWFPLFLYTFPQSWGKSCADCSNCFLLMRGMDFYEKNEISLYLIVNILESHLELLHLGHIMLVGDPFKYTRQTICTKFYKTHEGVYKYQKMSVISHGFWHSSKVNLPVIAWVCPLVLHPLKYCIRFLPWFCTPFITGGGLVLDCFWLGQEVFVLPFGWSFVFVDQQ